MSYESRPKTDAERSGTHTHECVDCERPFRCVGSDMCGESATCRCSQCYEDHVNREVAGTADTRVAVEREIVKWLRMTPTARKVAISIHSSQDIARLADAIERGEHRKPAKEGESRGESSRLPPSPHGSVRGTDAVCMPPVSAEPYRGIGRTGDCDCADDFTCAEHGGGHVLRDHK